MVVDPKKKWGKDILMPKKPLSAYLFYSTANMNKIKEEEKCSHPEAMKLCGEKWKKMTDKEKKSYNGQHDKDQLRYDN